VVKKASVPATTLPRRAPLPFVISTEAKRSGEISVWMLFLGSVFLAEAVRTSTLFGGEKRLINAA
jgi:hypothetical protein